MPSLQSYNKDLRMKRISDILMNHWNKKTAIASSVKSYNKVILLILPSINPNPFVDGMEYGMCVWRIEQK